MQRFLLTLNSPSCPAHEPKVSGFWLSSEAQTQGLEKHLSHPSDLDQCTFAETLTKLCLPGLSGPSEKWGCSVPLVFR